MLEEIPSPAVKLGIKNTLAYFISIIRSEVMRVKGIMLNILRHPYFTILMCRSIAVTCSDLDITFSYTFSVASILIIGSN